MSVSETRVEYHIYSSDLGGYTAMHIRTREEALNRLEQLRIQSPQENFKLVPVEVTA